LGSLTTVSTFAPFSPIDVLPSKKNGCPNSSTLSPHVAVTVPIAPSVRSPVLITADTGPPGSRAGEDAEALDGEAGADRYTTTGSPSFLMNLRSFVIARPSRPDTASGSRSRTRRAGTADADSPATRAARARVVEESRTTRGADV